MKTLIINGSPNGRKGNTEILCQRFINGMQTQPEILYIAESDASELFASMEGCDNWLFFFPMYVHAMPGIVKQLFEHMRPDAAKGIGFFVQYGFEEAAQSDYLRALLKNYVKRMGYRDLGLIVAGGMAGLRYMPDWMNKKTFTRIGQAGACYEQGGVLDQEIARQFGELYTYTEAQVKRNRFFQKLGLTDMFWNRMLKKNNSFDKRFDRPFGE